MTKAAHNFYRFSRLVTTYHSAILLISIQCSNVRSLSYKPLLYLPSFCRSLDGKALNLSYLYKKLHIFFLIIYLWILDTLSEVLIEDISYLFISNKKRKSYILWSVNCQ